MQELILAISFGLLLLNTFIPPIAVVIEAIFNYMFVKNGNKSLNMWTRFQMMKYGAFGRTPRDRNDITFDNGDVLLSWILFDVVCCMCIYAIVAALTSYNAVVLLIAFLLLSVPVTTRKIILKRREKKC